ncbi:ligase activity protein [[Candida] boidinii]|nr:ligase activity protein [[Candida] boidinii]
MYRIKLRSVNLISNTSKSSIRYFNSSKLLLNQLDNNKIELPDKDLTIRKFNFPSHTITVNEINKNLKNNLKNLNDLNSEKITLNGWIDGIPRKIGKNLIFAHFRDINGDLTQIVAKDEIHSKLLRSSKPEDSLSITGYINPKKNSQNNEISNENNNENENVNEIQWELNIDEIHVLNNSDVKVSQLESLKSIPSAYPPEYRYLQLRLPKYQNALKLRSKTASIIRNVFYSKNFTEIETPLLFKSTPEGAKEFLVPTRRKSFFYALPQSPQQYKQLLMASGVKNYFQIAKCFRDEDLRADRQPEFTQIDMEMSFAKSEDVQEVIETLITSVWKEIRKVPIYAIKDGDKMIELSKDEHFPKLKYNEALSKYGIDKPDLRSTIEFKNLNKFFKPIDENEIKEFKTLEICILKKAFDINDKKQIKNLPKSLFDENEYKTRKPMILPIKRQEDLIEWVNKIKGFELIESNINVNGELTKDLNIEIGDIIAISNRADLTYENPTPLGRFRQIAIKEFPNKWLRKLINKDNGEILPESEQPKFDDTFIGTWLVEFPLFSPIELDSETTNIKQDYPKYDYQKFESTHHPFTMANLEDYEYLKTNPLKVRGDHYDLVINGVECGGGSRRVHDSNLQRYIFTQILGVKDPDYLFGHLLNALSAGCPPHAGLAIGFDRLCAMLLGSQSIRDVVAFPKTQTGSDPVVGSPSQVPENTLKTYYVKTLE